MAKAICTAAPYDGERSRLLDECLVKFGDATRALPGSPSLDQLRRWRDGGIVVPGRALPVRLECIKIGLHWHTSHEAHARFVSAQNE